VADTFLDRLRETRADRAQEIDAHRFLLEAYSGTGGFSPVLAPPPASWWGASALDYARDPLAGVGSQSAAPWSWLDRYPREDDRKFSARVQVAHYPNYVEPLTDLKCSYVLREAYSVSEEPPAVTAWRANVDGDETTWDEWLPDLVSEAAVVGWVPVLVDSPPLAEGLSLAQSEDVGGGPTVTALHPSNLLDWSARGSVFEWVKIRTDHEERSSWDSECVKVERYAIWTATDCTVVRVVKREGEEAAIDGPPVVYTHGFGRVPLAILRHASGSDALRGRPMHWSVSQENKRLFNLVSEQDEHLRANVFALLVVPGRSGPGGDVDVGAQNGIEIDPDQKNIPYYLAPQESIARTYDTKIEATIREIHRIGRVEFSRPTAAAVSGVAREYEFEQTNRALSSFAQNIARFQLDIADLVGTAFRLDRAVRRKQRVDPPRSFAVQDLEREIKIAMDAITLKLGQHAEGIIRKKLVSRILPNLTTTDREAIEGEIDALAVQAEQERAVLMEGLASKPDPGEDDPAKDEEDDADVTDPKKPAPPPGDA